MSENGERIDGTVAGPNLRPGLFREDALRHHLGRRDFGDVLRLPPAWTRLAFPLILAFVAIAVAYLWFASVKRYEPGVGVVEERLIYALVPALDRRFGD